MEDKAIVISQEALPHSPVVEVSPMELAQSFLSAGGDLESLEKMMDLQDRHEKKQAQKEFVKAMAKFKESPIVIKKDKQNKQYNSRYSSLSAFVNPCLPIMGACGLSHKWEFEQIDTKTMKGSCIVTHAAGYSDSVSMICPIDMSGAKNAIQQIKSTRTYIKIETFASVMGLASSEDLDDDGNSSGVKPVTEKQHSQLVDMINATKSDEGEFLKYFKITSLDQLPVNLFGKAMSMLKAKL